MTDLRPADDEGRDDVGGRPGMREPRCCGEWKCRRAQPIRLVRSELSGDWYVLTRWKERPGVPGAVEAIDKHRLPEDLQTQLERMRDGNIAWRESELDCNITPPEGGSDAQQYDGFACEEER